MSRLHYGWVVLGTGTLVVFGSPGLARFGYTMVLPGMQKALGMDNRLGGTLATANMVGPAVCLAVWIQHPHAALLELVAWLKEHHRDRHVTIMQYRGNSAQREFGGHYHAALVAPSHGRFVGASSKPFAEYDRRPGETIGFHWRLPKVGSGRQVRHVIIDTNYWKSFVQARLAVGMGDRGCLSLFGAEPEQHRLLAEHLTAEYRVATTAQGRTVDEWKQRPHQPENHWLDCLVGNAAAASMLGVNLAGMVPQPRGRGQRKKYTQEDLRRKW